MILRIDCLTCWMGIALLKGERKYSTTQNISRGPGAVFQLVILVNWIKILLEPHDSSFMKCIHKNVNNLYLCEVQKGYWITWRKIFWSLSLQYIRFLKKDFENGTNGSHMLGSEQHPVKTDCIFMLPKTATLSWSSSRPKAAVKAFTPHIFLSHKW